MLPDIFYDSNGEIVWSAISATVSAISAVLVFVGVIMNICTQRKIAKQQIDANLKAKARIEWINGVRDKTSELISLLLSLQKEKTVFYEQWLEIEEVSELLKLYFNSKVKEKLNSEIYVDKNKIILSNSATFIVFKEIDNIDKHAYIKRYIECLVELYKEDNYQKIVSEIRFYSDLINKLYEENFEYTLSHEASDLMEIKNTSAEKLEGKAYDYAAAENNIAHYQKEIKKLKSRLIDYQKSIEDFSLIISLYLKIEWDKAKQGK
ncbi:hypothetical protein [Enterococcus thailandicus]|uniref:hypothetical protein n=1 Tax=Enterococcus thailandicus TaxID=417368 RepID=UPI0028906A14|nr:hypothetical protein [Enterococcus thailandicus]MDT2845525.1 hypothetical protein [Enterococcus thailandicus]